MPPQRNQHKHKAAIYEAHSTSHSKTQLAYIQCTIRTHCNLYAQLDELRVELEKRSARLTQLEKQLASTRAQAEESGQLVLKLRADLRSAQVLRFICLCWNTNIYIFQDKLYTTIVYTRINISIDSEYSIYCT